MQVSVDTFYIKGRPKSNDTSKLQKLGSGSSKNAFGFK